MGNQKTYTIEEIDAAIDRIPDKVLGARLDEELAKRGFEMMPLGTYASERAAREKAEAALSISRDALVLAAGHAAELRAAMLVNPEEVAALKQRLAEEEAGAAQLRVIVAELPEQHIKGVNCASPSPLHCPWCASQDKINAALASDAGAALLARLEAAERERDALRRIVERYTKETP